MLRTEANQQPAHVHVCYSHLSLIGMQHGISQLKQNSLFRDPRCLFFVWGLGTRLLQWLIGKTGITKKTHGRHINPIVLQAYYRESQVFLFANPTLYVPHLPLYFLDRNITFSLGVQRSYMWSGVGGGLGTKLRVTHIFNLHTLTHPCHRTWWWNHLIQ